MTDGRPRFRAAAIQELMEREGLSKAAFAKRAKVSRQLVGAWLSDWVQPRFDTVLRLCVTFHVEPTFFIEGLSAEPAEGLPAQPVDGIEQ